MANIILPAVPVLSEINDNTKLLIEQAGEINRYPISDLDIAVNQVIMPDGSRLNDKVLKPKAGFIYPLATTVVPEGFLLCDGAAYSRTEYPELFAAIGTIYGAGDGSTTFNVPNLATRVPVGAGEGYDLGKTGGEEEHKLTVNEMPKHRHSVNNQDNTVFMVPLGSYYGVISISSGNSTGYAGGDQPHNNMQPYTVVNYIIATGKDTGVSVQDIIAGVQALPLGLEYGGTGATNAADARKNLGITPEKIGALSMELLWENASIKSEFTAQHLSLDCTQYQYLAIEFAYTTSLGYRQTMLYRMYSGTTKFVYRLYAYNCVERYITVYTDYIDFDNGSLDGAENNGVAIPTQIYGIKGVIQ